MMEGRLADGMRRYWDERAQENAVGFERLLEPFENSLVLAHGYRYLPEGIYGVGVKGTDLTPERRPARTLLGDQSPAPAGPTSRRGYLRRAFS